MMPLALNYSLQHAKLQTVITTIALPKGGRARVKIAGDFSSEMIVEGTGEPISVPLLLNPGLCAQLDSPVKTELTVDKGEAGLERWPATVSPLSAWNVLEENALATAAFVLENDVAVGGLVENAGVAKDPADGSLPAEVIAERLYGELRNAFGPCYLFERKVFPPVEQAIRFPLQLKCDRGGTCIDYVLVYAAALLRSGLQPLVIILGEANGPRHAVAGIWLQPPGNEKKEKRTPVARPAALSALWSAGRFFPVEVTWALSGRPFGEARRAGDQALARAALLWGIDVRGARDEGVDSLPGKPCETTFRQWEARVVDQRTETLISAASGILQGLILEVVDSPREEDRGKRWTDLRGSRMLIGRHRDAQISLRDGSVSEHHAVLFVDGTEICIEENPCSKNGTRIDDKWVFPGRPNPVRIGQVIQIGGVKLRLSRGSSGQGGKP